MSAAQVRAESASDNADKGASSARSSLVFDDRANARARPSAEGGNIPKELPPWYGMMEMPHEKLVEYMGVIGADKQFITLMIEGQTDGPAWRALISNADSSSVREDLEECIAAWTGEEFPLAHAPSCKKGLKTWLA